MNRLTFLILVSAFFIASCETPQYSHIEVYNGYNERVEFTLNNELHKINPNEVAYFKSEKRAQLFQFGQTKELIKTKENERFLINLALDTIIKEELLYGTAYSTNSSASGGVIPSTLIKLRGKKYFGPYEITTGKLVIRKYDFSLKEKAPQTITSSSSNPYAQYSKKWNEYYKLSTVDGFVASNQALNDREEFINPIVLASSKILKEGIEIDMQQTSIFLKDNGQNIGYISKARVTNNDLLELYESKYYQKERDGAMKEIIMKIPNCDVVMENGTRHKGALVDVIMVEKWPNPRIIIK